MSALAAWFRSRTAREQLLLQAGAFILIVGGGLFWGWQTASAYRASAAADLAIAQQIRADIARLDATPTPAAAPIASDGTPRGAATAIAAQVGLAPTHIEPEGPTAVRISFGSAPSASVYAWIDAVERAGLVVTRIALVRAGPGDLVQADASVAARRP
jgi:type II secretory pathway component PulM